MTGWFGITNYSGYGVAAPGQVVSIDSPLASNSTCTSPINHWNCSMSGQSGACTGSNAYVVTGACGTAWGQLVGTTGSSITMSAYDTTGPQIFSFKVDTSTGIVINVTTSYTFANGTTVTYGCSSAKSTNPYGNSGYLFEVYVASVSIPTKITFINKTTAPLSINYPTTGLSNWSGATNQGNYQINPGLTATGQDNGFIASAISGGGVQLAGYTSAEIYSYLAKFSANQPPAISAGPGSPTAQSQYTCLSSYEASTNTYTITMIPTPAPIISWDASSPVLKRNGQPTVLHGLALSSMEYLLGGIGMKSFATYSYGTNSVDFTQPNLTEMNEIFKNLPSVPGVTPSVRIALNASYYLGVVTPEWQAKAAAFPNSTSFSSQYQTLLNNMVTYFTARGVVCILDLHWNDEVTEQRPMALNTTKNGPTGDSLAFLNAISLKYGTNPLVWYELYNEPYLQTSEYSLYRDGGTSADGSEVYYGMKTLYNAVRNNTANPIIIAGSSDYAYDATSLIQFQKDVNPVNVLYNFHPYMGGGQGSEKSPAAFEVLVNSMITNVGKPVILTEAGQYCCVSNGDCGSYTASNNVGYLEAILQIAQKYNLSWTVWGWIPNTAGTCSPINANNGDILMTCAAGQACGANYSNLIPTYGIIGPKPTK